MSPTLRVVSSLFFLVSIACGGSGSGPTEGSATTAPASSAGAAAWSCLNPTAGRCTQYSESSTAMKEAGGPDGMERLCGLQKGTWHATACATTAHTGVCTKPSATTVCLNDACATSYAKSCAGGGGAWTSGG